MRTYNRTSGPCSVTRRDLVESNHAQRTSADRVLLCFFLGILCLQHPASSAAERLFGHRARLYNLQRPCAPKSLWQLSCLPRAVVEVRVPRGPGAVEGERQLLVVLVLLTPHPKGREHLVCTPQGPDCQAMRGPHKRPGAPSCAGGARQQKSTPSSAAAGFYPARAPDRHRAAGRHAAA